MKLFSTARAATLIGVSRRQVQNLVARGEIGSVKVGRWRRFRREDVDAYLERCVEPPKSRHRRRLLLTAFDIRMLERLARGLPVLLHAKKRDQVKFCDIFGASLRKLLLRRGVTKA